MNADLLVADKTQLFEYKILTDRLTNKTKTVKEPLYDILKRRELADEEWVEVKKVCDNLGIEFFLPYSRSPFGTNKFGRCKNCENSLIRY